MSYLITTRPRTTVLVQRKFQLGISIVQFQTAFCKENEQCQGTLEQYYHACSYESDVATPSRFAEGMRHSYIVLRLLTLPYYGYLTMVLVPRLITAPYDKLSCLLQNGPAVVANLILLI